MCIWTGGLVRENGFMDRYENLSQEWEMLADLGGGVQNAKWVLVPWFCFVKRVRENFVTQGA